MLNTQLKSRPYLKFAMAAALVWTVSAAASLVWNLRSQEAAVRGAARAAAKTAYDKEEGGYYE